MEHRIRKQTQRYTTIDKPQIEKSKQCENSEVKKKKNGRNEPWIKERGCEWRRKKKPTSKDEGVAERVVRVDLALMRDRNKRKRKRGEKMGFISREREREMKGKCKCKCKFKFKCKFRPNDEFGEGIKGIISTTRKR